MKFNCPNCSAKYQIPDDKLTGRVAKMKCRKCGTLIPIVATPSRHSILAAPSVRGTSLKPEREAPAPPSIPSQLEGDEWHAGINGSPVGPMTRTEVGERIKKGEITAETFVWRDGMDGWKVVPEVAELSALLGEAPPLLAPPSMPPKAKAQRNAAPAPARVPSIIHTKPIAPAVAPPRAPGKDKPKVAAAGADAPVQRVHVQSGAAAVLDLEASFGLEVPSTRLPEKTQQPAQLSVSPTQQLKDLASTVTPLITEAPIPEIAMPDSSQPSSGRINMPSVAARRPSMFSVRPSYESLVAELKRRRKHPWAVPFIVSMALGLGVTLGFVVFGNQKTKIIREVVEVPTQVAQAAQDKSLADADARPADTEDAALPSGRPSASSKTEKNQGTAKVNSATPASSPTAISQGLKGLSGLDGLGGPATGPTISTGASNGQPLDASQIQSTVSQYQSGVKRGCWQPALMSRDKDAPSTARVSIAISVAADGQVKGVSSSGDPKGYPGLSSCITGRVRGWRFPRSGGPTTVNVPFVFAAQ